MDKEPRQKDSIVICWILRVIGIISNCVIAFGIAALAFCMVLLGVAAGNIKTEKGEIKVFDEVIKYNVVEKSGALEFSYNEESTVISKNMLQEVDKKLEAKDVVNFLDDLSVTKLLGLVESVLFIGIVVLFITFLIIRKFIRVLKNTIREKTPLLESNVNDLMSIANAYLAIWIFTVIATVVIELVFTGMRGLTVGASSSLIPAAVFYLVAWTVSCGINNKAEVAEEKPKTSRKKTVKE